ncbi:hypothetical protein [Wenyingzhuangia sp. IMCC45574]
MKNSYKMNDLFNFLRFKNLVLSFLLEKGKTALLYVFLITLGVLGIMVFTINDYKGFTTARELLFILYLIILVALVINLTTKDLKIKNRMAQYLLTPSSSLEKVVYIHFVFFLFLGVALLLFRVLDYLIIYEIIPYHEFNKINNLSSSRELIIEPLDYLKDGMLVFYLVIYIVTFTTSIFQITPKGTFVSVLKFAIIPVFFIVPSLANLAVLGDRITFTTSNLFSFPFQKVRFKNRIAEKYSIYQGSSFTTIEIALYFFLPIAIMIALVYYFKLKEKEV